MLKILKLKYNVVLTAGLFVVMACLFLLPISINSVQAADVVVASKPTITIAGYHRYLQLIKALPDVDMRSDGVQIMTGLKKKYNQISLIPAEKIFTLFESLLKRYPLENNEAFIYQLSREFEANGQKNEALKAFTKLIDDYPGTRFYDNAQFRKAEILYSKFQYSEAEMLYKKVIEFKNKSKKSNNYERAVYKQGWSQFKQMHFDQALNSFMHLLDLHAKNNDFQLSSMSISEKKFIEEVLRAINLSFSYQAGPITAYEFFSRNKKRVYEFHVFASLAEYYKREGNIKDAAQTYRLFVSYNATHIMAPIFLINIIELYKRNGLSDLEIEAKKYFVQQYTIDNVYWGLYGASNTGAQLLALNINLYQLARHYQRQAQKTSDLINIREAQRWFRNWLAAFPNDNKAADMHYQLAEVLKQGNQNDLAIIEYEKAAYDYKKFKKSAQAAYNALLIAENKEQDLSGFAKQQWRKVTLNKAIVFAQRFPNHKEAGSILSDAKVNLNKIRLKEEGYQASKKAAPQLAIVSNDHILQESVEYNQASTYIGARNWQQAAQVLERFREHYPKHPLQKNVTEKLAMIYLANDEIQKATLEYVKMSYTPDLPKRQADALWLAADLSEQVRNNKQARKIYIEYIKRFSSSVEQSIEARQRLIELYERNEKTKKVEQWRVNLINTDAKAGKSRTQRTRYLAANASLALALPSFNLYRKTKLMQPLEKSLSTKYELMNKTIAFYDRAASYNITQSLTDSTYRIAQIYQDMAFSIVNSERPGGLSEKEWLEYSQSLVQRAKTYEEKAVEFYEINVAFSKENKSSIWMEKSLKKLKKIFPQRYN